jgi:hypothetical protein
MPNCYCSFIFIFPLNCGFLKTLQKPRCENNVYITITGILSKRLLISDKKKSHFNDNFSLAIESLNSTDGTARKMSYLKLIFLFLTVTVALAESTKVIYINTKVKSPVQSSTQTYDAKIIFAPEEKAKCKDGRVNDREGKCRRVINLD